MINTPNIIFTTEYVAKIGGKYYFVASEMNAVCSIDVQTERVEIIGSIPEEAVFSERVCAKIVVWNGELIFVPMNGKKIWFYRLEGKIWHSLYIKNEKLQRKVRQAFIYKDKLFMVGCHYPAIICVDLITEDVKYIEAPFKVVQDIYIKRDLYGYFRHDCVLKENLLYFASFITNKVLLFNLEDFHWEYVTVGKSENGYSGIAWDGKFEVIFLLFWCFGRRSLLLKNSERAPYSCPARAGQSCVFRGPQLRPILLSFSPRLSSWILLTAS